MSILETGVKAKDKRLFVDSLHPFLDKNFVNERLPFPAVYASLVSSLSDNNEHCPLFCSINLHSVTYRVRFTKKYRKRRNAFSAAIKVLTTAVLSEYISPLKKTTKGGRKFSFNVFSSVLNSFFRTFIIRKHVSFICLFFFSCFLFSFFFSSFLFGFFHGF